MMDWVLDLGYLGLFLLSFVASTLIAAPSDVVAMTMPTLGYSAWWVGVVALAGGMLGGMVNYAMGRYGAAFLLARFFPEAQKENRWYARAERLYQRYGVYSLLLVGLPFIGDPMSAVAGVFKVRFVSFLVLTFIGRAVKFMVLLGLVVWGMQQSA